MQQHHSKPHGTFRGDSDFAGHANTYQIALGAAEPCLIQSAFELKTGERVLVCTSGGNVKTFYCDENWKAVQPACAEGIVPKDLTATQYHLGIRAAHGPVGLVPKHSTDLTPAPVSTVQYAVQQDREELIRRIAQLEKENAALKEELAPCKKLRAFPVVVNARKISSANQHVGAAWLRQMAQQSPTARITVHYKDADSHKTSVPFTDNDSDLDLLHPDLFSIDVTDAVPVRHWL